MWDEAMKSTPWLDSIGSRFSYIDPSTGDRVITNPLEGLRGVVLTPKQMDQMMGLAQDRLTRDEGAYRRAQGEAKTGYGTMSSDKDVNIPSPGTKQRQKGDHVMYKGKEMIITSVDPKTGKYTLGNP